MAKQTFTTGQVLTSAQMTSLQQTAMLGGDTTAKTASYVLVAADAGTTVAMNAAGATTITVNTGLFAAGDTVFIQNRGAGVCTVTAGTATVACAGSLALPQNDAGILYFTSASAATFYDFIQVGATSPLTTKGDLYTYSTSDARLPVGSNDQILVADSSTSTGLKWAAASSGGMTLITTTTFNNTVDTYTYSSLGSHKHLLIVIDNMNTSAVASVSNLAIRMNGITSSDYHSASWGCRTAGTFDVYDGQNGTYALIRDICMNSTQGNNQRGVVQIWIYDYAGSTRKTFSATARGYTTANTVNTLTGYLNTTNAITSVTILNEQANNFNEGTLKLYGVS